MTSYPSDNVSEVHADRNPTVDLSLLEVRNSGHQKKGPRMIVIDSVASGHHFETQKSQNYTRAKATEGMHQ